TTCTIFSDRTPSAAAAPLSLHDALPICRIRRGAGGGAHPLPRCASARDSTDACAPGATPLERAPGHEHQWKAPRGGPGNRHPARSEEHTSELQSRENLVCRLLLEKKKIT